MNIPIREGGLYRCCGASLQKEDPPRTEGARYQCPHCKEWLVFRDGAWEWDPLHS